MPLPPGVTVLRVTVGPYAAPDGSPAFVGARGRVTISPRVRHVATGTVLVEKPIPVRIGDDGTAAFEVPHSGQPGFDRDGWEYRLDWLDDRLRSVRFSVPVGSGDERRLTDLVASPVDRGVLVPLAPGSGMAAGGQTGQVLAKNSGADYDTAWTDPPDLTGYVTDDTLAAAIAALPGSPAPDLSSYVTDTQLAAALVGAASGDVDLTGYVTDDELATALEDLTPRLITDAERAKLAGVAPGATANASDADLRDRITHTGHQDASTVTGLATVATSGTYGDLTGRPALAPVATSGAYPDLTGKPTIPTLPTLAPVATSGAYPDLSGRPALAPVATSGAYDDLTGKPTIPAATGGTVTLLATGLWSTTPHGQRTTGATVLNAMYVYPIYLDPAGPALDALSIEVTTATTGGVLRFGIYERLNPATMNLTLVREGDAQPGASPVGLKMATLTPPVTHAGRHLWIAVATQGVTTPTVRIFSSQPPLGGIPAADPTGTGGGVSGYATGISGALPATLTLAATVASPVPIIWTRGA